MRAPRICPSLVCLAAVLSAVACSGRKGDGQTLRLGYLPNLTHAQALVGTSDGTFFRALGGKLELKSFNAGPSAVEALLGGSLDAVYLGSSPAILAYVRSEQSVRVIATGVSGGSVLVARHATTPAGLKGQKIATPQLGNSQDVALRHWLKTQGLRDSDFGDGDVAIVPVSNADALGLMKRGELEAAWVPEPWGARLMAEAGAHVLVDERTLWPDGKFPTTLLLVSTQALAQKRPQLLALLKAHVELTARWESQPAAFMEKANEAFAKTTQHPLPGKVLKDAFSRMEPFVPPLPGVLTQVAENLQGLGYLPSADVSGIVDDSLLREVMLETAQKPPPALH
jgi:NitT/TauT family transport system substrate-binding protein